MEYIALLYESREVVIKSFNDYSSIISETKYKTIPVKEIPSMSTSVSRGRIAKIYDRKISHHSNIRILDRKQMLQRLIIALAQVKAGNKS